MNVERDAKGFTERGWIEFGFRELLRPARLRLPAAADGRHGLGRPSGPARLRPGLRAAGRGPRRAPPGSSGLDAGRSFVTTGPMLFVTLDGHDPGHRFEQADAGGPRVPPGAARRTSAVPLERIEVVVNGEVARTLRPANRQTERGSYESPIEASLPIDGDVLGRGPLLRGPARRSRPVRPQRAVPRRRAGQAAAAAEGGGRVPDPAGRGADHAECRRPPRPGAGRIPRGVAGLPRDRRDGPLRRRGHDETTTGTTDSECRPAVQRARAVRPRGDRSGSGPGARDGRGTAAGGERRARGPGAGVPRGTAAGRDRGRAGESRAGSATPRRSSGRSTRTCCWSSTINPEERVKVGRGPAAGGPPAGRLHARPGQGDQRGRDDQAAPHHQPAVGPGLRRARPT